MDKQLQLAYFAGLVDGEAYIGITRKQPGKGSFNPTFHITIELAMTDLQTVQDFALFFNTPTFHKKNRKTDVQNNIYLAAATNKKALDILLQLYPYLRLKKPIVDLCIELRNNIEQHKSNLSKGVRFNRKHSPETINFRIELWKKSKSLTGHKKHTFPPL